MRSQPVRWAVLDVPEVREGVVRMKQSGKHALRGRLGRIRPQPLELSDALTLADTAPHDVKDRESDSNCREAENNCLVHTRPYRTQLVSALEPRRSISAEACKRSLDATARHATRPWDSSSPRASTAGYGTSHSAGDPCPSTPGRTPSGQRPPARLRENAVACWPGRRLGRVDDE